MSDPLYPLYSVAAFLGFIAVLAPLPWHLQAWNVGTCAYMIWTALACLNCFTNSVVWSNDAINRAPIWCDISIRIFAGATLGIPASALCIVRRLYKIASLNSTSVTRAEKRRAVMLDLFIAVVFPIILTALQYVVQGHRFDVIEEVGCMVFLYNTPVAYVITFMWPVIFGVVSAVYCVLSLLAFRRRQLDLQQFMHTNKSMTINRYLRLMALASVETICTTPLAIFVIVLNSTTMPVQSWVSWEDTHFNFSRVAQIPSVMWRTNHLLVVSLQLSRWAPILCAFVFFMFFGFAEESRKNYAALFRSIARYIGLSRFHSTMQSKNSSKWSLGSPGEQPPSYSRRCSPQTTSTSWSETITPVDPSPFIVPFDFERSRDVFSNPPPRP
ncbi:putative fungal pheromoneG-protein-coupled receptor [Pterulicium gracile]|uniref:Putative fungal pheromoneG-protein-coupled receptor n=1 Tax=Pterulicium gracile TaxID=1884261 RepID=A0A5C3Q187_9AGAR|nr:putative fungal pheromoneG-protein-coupled receptor [Pterula gracilis]